MHALGIDWEAIEAGTVFQARAVSRATSLAVAETLEARGLELEPYGKGAMRVMPKRTAAMGSNAARARALTGDPEFERLAARFADILGPPRKLERATVQRSALRRERDSFAVGEAQLGLPLVGQQTSLGELLGRTHSPASTFDASAAEGETQRRLAVSSRKIQARTLAEAAFNRASQGHQDLRRNPGAILRNVDRDVAEAVREYWLHRGDLLDEPWEGADNSIVRFASDARAVRAGFEEAEREGTTSPLTAELRADRAAAFALEAENPEPAKARKPRKR